MRRRHDGYVVDVPYIESVSADICPAWLSMISVLNGQPPLPDRPLVWSELGSGSGLAACVVGATNAEITVWGCDVNPAHVERSREIALRAGLPNCAFDLASFAEVARDPHVGPAEVDVVVVHGVFSWVSPENQRHIAEFVRRRLRPGGLVYVSYEVPTGWAATVPVAEALRLLSDADPRPSPEAIGDAHDRLTRIARAGAPWFPMPPMEQHRFDDLTAADPRYSVHEYLGAHFAPVMFDEVVATMDLAGCSHVGSIETTDHRPGWWAPPDLLEVVTGTDDLVLREMMRDVATQRSLRRSIFRRGLAPVTHFDRTRWAAGLSVVGLGKDLSDGATVPVPVGQVSLDLDYHRPLVASLLEAPLDVGRVMSLLPTVDADDALTALAVLVAGGYAFPEAHRSPPTDVVGASMRLNRLLIEENLRGADHSFLAAPTIGSAVSADYVEMLVIGALWAGAVADRRQLVDYTMTELARQGRHVREAGALLTQPRAARRVIDERVDRALRRRSSLSRLGCGEVNSQR